MRGRSSATVRPFQVQVIKVEPGSASPPDDGEDRKDAAPDTVTAVDDIPLYTIMRPMFLQMKFFGLFFPTKYNMDHDDDEADEDGDRAQKRARYAYSAPSGLRVYATLILAIIWINVGRSMAMFSRKETFSASFFTKLLVLAFVVMSAVSCTTLYLASHRKGAGMARFCHRWHRLQARREPASLKHIAMHVRLMSGSVIGLVVLNSGFTGYGMYHSSLFDITIAPFSVTDPYVDWYRAVYLLLHSYTTAAWGYMMVTQFILCLVLKHEFTLFNEAFTRASKNRGRRKRFHGNIEEFREWHNDICGVVGNADDVCSLHVAALFMGSIVDVCMILYLVIYDDAILADPLLATTNMMWLCSAGGALLATCIYAAVVNHAAHAAYEDVHSLNLEGISQETAFQVSVFLNRLSGSSIGLTALKMFVIDKPTILTLIGMLITYFVLIIQFAPTSGSDASPAACNCSELLLNATLTCYSHN